MKMENNNITGDEVMELIREKRRLFNDKARFPNAILIHPGYYAALKEVMGTDNHLMKKIFDLEIFVTEDTSSFQLIRIYDHDECSI